MKKIFPDKIVNIEGTDIFDQKFLFDYLEFDYDSNPDIEVIYMSELLELRKNEEIFWKIKQKPGIYSNVYSPKDELEIFTELFENAIKNQKKIHIIWVTLDEEIKMLEQYYTQLWFMREDINCFDPEFYLPMVTVSVKIENIMWKGSDYKRMWEKIFFHPPVRESWEVKAMFKWINRWVIAGIYIKNKTPEVLGFISDCVRNEKILPLTLAKLLKYNLANRGFNGIDRELIIKY